MAEFIRRLIIPIQDLWQPLMEILHLRMACMSLFTNRWIHTTPTAYQASCFPFFSVSFGCGWQCTIKAWFRKVDEFWIFVESCYKRRTNLHLFGPFRGDVYLAAGETLSLYVYSSFDYDYIAHAESGHSSQCHDAPSPFSGRAAWPALRPRIFGLFDW